MYVFLDTILTFLRFRYSGIFWENYIEITPKYALNLQHEAFFLVFLYIYTFCKKEIKLYSYLWWAGELPTVEPCIPSWMAALFLHQSEINEQ